MASKGSKRKSGSHATTVTQYARIAAGIGISTEAGKSAIANRYLSGIVVTRGCSHTVSMDLDNHFRTTEPHAPRWDYGVGIIGSNGTELAFWVEAHPASSTGEAQKMLAKLAWLKSKLAQGQLAKLNPLTQAAKDHGSCPYRWLAQTGENRIPPNSREARLIAAAGLDQPRRQVQLP